MADGLTVPPPPSIDPDPFFSPAGVVFVEPELAAAPAAAAVARDRRRTILRSSNARAFFSACDGRTTGR